MCSGQSWGQEQPPVPCPAPQFRVAVPGTERGGSQESYRNTVLPKDCVLSRNVKGLLCPYHAAERGAAARDIGGWATTFPLAGPETRPWVLLSAWPGRFPNQHLQGRRSCQSPHPGGTGHPGPKSLGWRGGFAVPSLRRVPAAQGWGVWQGCGVLQRSPCPGRQGRGCPGALNILLPPCHAGTSAPMPAPVPSS